MSELVLKIVVLFRVMSKEKRAMLLEFVSVVLKKDRLKEFFCLCQPLFSNYCIA